MPGCPLLSQSPTNLGSRAGSAHAAAHAPGRELDVAHVLGSSHGESRVIRQAYFEHPAYVPLLLRSYELWADLERRVGRNLLVKTGGLMTGYETSEVVCGSLRSAREHHLDHELMTAADIRRRFPAMRPLDDEVGLYEPHGGFLFPEECNLAHLETAIAAGAEARFGVRVTGWSVTSQGAIRVQTSQGEVLTERLVLTAGGWFNKLAPELGLPLQLERNVMHWFEPVGNTDQMAPGRFPIYLLQRRERPVIYGFPFMAGRGIKVAIHHSKQNTTIDEIDRQVAPAEVAEVQRLFAAFVPDGAGAWRSSAACFYTNTPDDHFVVGLHPKHPQVVLAGGFSGHGFKFASVIGEVLADLTTEGATRHPIGFLSPARFGHAS